MKLSRRKRISNAVKRETSDHFPTWIAYTPEMIKKIADHLEVKEDALAEKLDNHMIQLAVNDKLKRDEKAGIEYDIWGIGWDTAKTEGFLVRHRPLEDKSKIGEYKFPDINQNLDWDDVRIKVEDKKKSDVFVLSDQGFLLFERAHCLRGFEALLMDFALEPDSACSLLDRITDVQIEMARKYIEIGVDGGYTGDDYGSQKGMLISPDMWRKLIKPRLAEVWAVYREAGLPVFHHSCGDVREIIDDLIEIGLNVLMPIQPQAMPIDELEEKWGSKLSFCGGISVQQTLPFGTPEEVRAEVEKTISTLGKHNGYIIGPSHEMTSDIPLNNFDAMMEAVESYKTGSVRG